MLLPLVERHRLKALKLDSNFLLFKILMIFKIVHAGVKNFKTSNPWKSLRFFASFSKWKKERNFIRWREGKIPSEEAKIEFSLRPLGIRYHFYVYACVCWLHVRTRVCVWREGGFLVKMQHFEHLCTSLPLIVQYRIPYPISLQRGSHLDSHQSFTCHLSHVISALDSMSFFLISSTSTGYLFGGDEPNHKWVILGIFARLPVTKNVKYNDGRSTGAMKSHIGWILTITRWLVKHITLEPEWGISK